jgi:hypothetical protein
MMHSNMPEPEQALHIADSLQALQKHSGRLPLGWLSQDWGTTAQTYGLLADAGLHYTLDWGNDDQPYWLEPAGTSARRLLALPLSSEWDDVQAQWLRHREGHEHAARRGILEHAAACAAAREPLGQAEQAAEPVEHVRLQFRARGRRGPEHALHADSGREQLAEDRRPAGAGREVAEEGGMLPVQEPRRDDPVKVSEHIG